MLLSIYYFFKGIKPMDPDLNLNTTLGWARANCEPDDKKLIEEILEDKLLLLYEKMVNATGDTYYPPLQQKLEKAFEIAEGNYELN